MLLVVIGKLSGASTPLKNEVSSNDTFHSAVFEKFPSKLLQQEVSRLSMQRSNMQESDWRSFLKDKENGPLQMEAALCVLRRFATRSFFGEACVLVSQRSSAERSVILVDELIQLRLMHQAKICLNQAQQKQGPPGINKRIEKLHREIEDKDTKKQIIVGVCSLIVGFVMGKSLSYFPK